MKALSAVVQGVHFVLAKLIGVDGDVRVLVLAAENNGAQCLVCLQGPRDDLATLWTQLVPGSIELLTPVNRESRDKGKGKDKSVKIDEINACHL